jgi:hypothetical protein
MLFGRKADQSNQVKFDMPFGKVCEHAGISTASPNDVR